MKILGIRLVAGLPIIEVLCTFYNNSSHKNHLEIARDYWNVGSPKLHAVILLWENDMTVYNQRSFQS